MISHIDAQPHGPFVAYHPMPYQAVGHQPKLGFPGCGQPPGSVIAAVTLARFSVHQRNADALRT